MGLAVNHFFVPPVVTMIALNSRNTHDVVNEHVQFLLKVLPKGTRFLGYLQGITAGLSIPFYLKFEHPLFDDGTQIEESWHRDFYMENNQIVELNVFSGLKFKKPDGTYRYP